MKGSCRWRLLAVSLLSCVALGLAPGCQHTPLAPGATERSVAFVGVSVLPMDGERVLEGQTVVVREGRIVAVGPEASITIPLDAERIDGRGRYLMPGLADFHIHLNSEEQLLSYLAHGVTSVFDLEGSPERLRLRGRIAQGKQPGPTLYVSSPLTDGDPPVFGNAVVVATPEQAPQTVQDHKRAGYDAIKVYNNLSPEVYAALAAAAREQQLPLVGHVPRKVGLEGVLQARQALLSHGEEYFNVDPAPESIPGAVRATKEAGTTVVPNLARLASTQRMLADLEGVFADPEARYLHPDVLRNWRGSNPTRRLNLAEFTAREQAKYPFVQQLTRSLAEAGVPLLLGTDSSQAGLFPGQSAHLELRELVKAGLTPYQALATGTRNAGAFITQHVDPAARFGTVALGQRADLLLVEGNPLEDLGHVARPLGVMVRGRWWTREQLQKQRERSAAALPKR
jgi:imidazolonepropionase-like amidohydrolase